MRVVAHYNVRFDADLAVAMLGDAGIEGVVISHTTSEQAGLGRVRGYSVAVRVEVAEDAVVLLTNDGDNDAEAEALDQIYHRRRFADRPTWVRYATYSLLVAMVGPFAVTSLIQAYWLIDSLFP